MVRFAAVFFAVALPCVVAQVRVCMYQCDVPPNQGLLAVDCPDPSFDCLDQTIVNNMFQLCGQPSQSPFGDNFDNFVINGDADTCLAYAQELASETYDEHVQAWQQWFYVTVNGCEECADGLSAKAKSSGVLDWLNNNKKLLIETAGSAGCVVVGISNPALAPAMWTFCASALGLIAKTAKAANQTVSMKTVVPQLVV